MARRKVIQGTAIPALQSFFRSYASPAAPGRGAPPISRLGIPNVNHIIAVASGKGGVGKSTTAVNLAVAMANNLGLRIGVLDADIYGPSIPRLLHLQGKPEVDSNELMLPLKNHGVTAMSMGFLIDEDAAAVWRGPMVMSALDTFIRKVNWGNLDCLVIDMPPGTGDAQITISQRLALSGAVIVSTPQDLALLDARRGVTMFRKVNVPILGIVENMSWFVCGNCGQEAHVFGHGGASKTAKDMDMEVLGEIPLNIDIRETSDAGVPIVVSKPDSAAAKAYVNVAEQVWQQLQRGDLLNSERGPLGPPTIEIRKQ
jgi:ATP-binding protein involved in chromosome partitioning